MFSIQGLIVLVVVVWYSLIILKSTNSYYKEAYKKHLEDESRPYEPGKLTKEIGNVHKVDQSENKMIHQENKAELIREEYCQEDEEMDVCFLNSEESLVLEKMYKSYP
ncbi:uncharacterized protein LOC103520868 [Diaphorina citri]|uniref:Uncharacterized protein LOC103520868 n=1 Tax=Diaphorina citri TaxID=121845 RepID=A0A1S3DLB1_DIACI|nr:uncharacterized protein LOC103520868 [Diaphorina citri]